VAPSHIKQISQKPEIYSGAEDRELLIGNTGKSGKDKFSKNQEHVFNGKSKY